MKILFEVMNKTKFYAVLAMMALALPSVAQVRFNDKLPAVDTLTNTWLLVVPQSVFGSDYHAMVGLDSLVTYCVIDSVPVVDEYTFTNVQPNVSYHFTMAQDSDTVSANIQFTYLPVLQLYGDFVKRPYRNGTVVISYPDSLAQDTLISRIRWAGSSTASSSRNKRNFHLKFYNEDGSKKDMSFFGLRSDFHWRLDAGQIDFSRVRNRVAKDLWAEFSIPPYYAAYEPKTPRNYVRGEFVEVFLNDQYWGISCLNEHMDRQQLKLKKYDYETNTFHGALWKPMQLTNITMFYGMAAIDPTLKYWSSFYVKYPNIDDVNPTNFQTLLDAIKYTILSDDSTFVATAGDYFDIPVFRDYYLLLTLLQGIDNIGKNVYYACYDVQESPRLTLAAWDMDTSQGQLWDNTNSNYHDPRVGPEVDFWSEYLSQHQVFSRLYNLFPSFRGLATEKYWSLRNTILNPDSIVARYEHYFDQMKGCGADQREITRWSKDTDLGRHELDFDAEIEYLRDWWHTHIAYLDENVFIPYPQGDVNFDRIVNITDVGIIIDYLLDFQVGDINTVRADFDGDGKINIQDVSAIIDVLLGLET